VITFRTRRFSHLGILELTKANAMTIAARYENGVFKPLEDVKLTEGTRVEVHVPGEAAPKLPKSVRDLPIFGMWADCDDIPDGVTYEDRIRHPRH
jgi:Protein of unknown function DUF104